MKKRVPKAIKLVVAFLLLVVLITVFAILSPMPDIPKPEKHDRILIKSINVVDVTTGEIIPNQNVFKEQNRITSIKSADTSKA